MGSQRVGHDWVTKLNWQLKEFRRKHCACDDSFVIRHTHTRQGRLVFCIFSWRSSWHIDMPAPPRKLPSFLSSALPRPVRVFAEGKSWVSWAGVLISGSHSLPSWWPCWHPLLRPAVVLIQWGVSEGQGSGLFSPQDTEPQCWYGSAWVAEAFQNSQRSMRVGAKEHEGWGSLML